MARTYEAGYYLGQNDSIGMATELMNMATVSQTAYVTVTWEYIRKPPPSFSNVKVLWLDIGGCNGSSEQPTKSTTQGFQYTSTDWISDIDGGVTFIGGHLHDGGTHLNVKKNGIDQCDCVAMYDTPSVRTSNDRDVSATMSPDAVHGTLTGHSESTSNMHISDISVCRSLEDVLVEPGDTWTITAHYDPAQHDLMMDMDGKPEPVMGIALVYVADKDVIFKKPSSLQSSKLQASLWPVAVLLVAAAALTYFFYSKKRIKRDVEMTGYKLLRTDES